MGRANQVILGKVENNYTRTVNVYSNNSFSYYRTDFVKGNAENVHIRNVNIQLDDHFGIATMQFINGNNTIAIVGSGRQPECGEMTVFFDLIDVTDKQVIFHKETCSTSWKLPFYVASSAQRKVVVVFPDFWDTELTASPIGVSYLAEINSKTGKYNEIFIHHDELGIPIAISPDDRFLTIQQTNGDVAFYRIGASLVLDQIVPGIALIGFDPTGNTFFAIGKNGRMEIRDSQTKKIRCQTDDEDMGRVGFVSNVNGQLALLWRSELNEILVLDTVQCKIQQKMYLHSFRENVSISADNRLIAGAGGKIPWVYDITAREYLPNTFPQDSQIGEIWDVEFSSDQSRTLFIGGSMQSDANKGFIYKWDMKNEKLVFGTNDNTVTNITVDKQDLVAVQDLFWETTLWDADNGFSKFPVNGSQPSFSPHGVLLAAMEYSSWQPSYIRIMNVESKRTLAKFPGGFPINFSSDSKMLAYTSKNSDDKTKWSINIRGVDQRADLLSINIQPYTEIDGCAFCQLAFHPNGTILAIDTEFEIILWDIQADHLLKIIQMPTGSQNLSFSPDGRWLAVMNSDGTMSLWGIPQP